VIGQSADLPPAIADRFTIPFARLLEIKVATGVMLFVATIASKWSIPFSAFWEIPIGLHFGSLDFTRSLRLWINEGLMTLFFFVVALELKHSLVMGKLRTWRIAALSFAGALGGMLVPATLYVALMNSPLEMFSWGTVVATDTAFVIGCLALLGSRIPPSLRLFLLSLAVFDDVGAIGFWRNPELGSARPRRPWPCRDPRSNACRDQERCGLLPAGQRDLAVFGRIGHQSNVSRRRAGFDDVNARMGERRALARNPRACACLSQRRPLERGYP
jgi:hypothetical protein